VEEGDGALRGGGGWGDLECGGRRGGRVEGGVGLRVAGAGDVAGSCHCWALLGRREVGMKEVGGELILRLRATSGLRMIKLW
jgi:hypothetical protein